DQARQSKVGQVRFAVFIQQDVPWLNIAMQNSVLVRKLNSARNLHEQLSRLPDGRWFTFGDLIQATAFDELHAEVTRAVALPDFVNGNNLRMLQTRRRLGLMTKTF